MFDEMREETQMLKKKFEENPQDQDLINTIKDHENNFKLLYDEFCYLNKKLKNK